MVAGNLVRRRDEWFGCHIDEEVRSDGREELLMIIAAYGMVNLRLLTVIGAPAISTIDFGMWLILRCDWVPRTGRAFAFQ